MNTVSDTAPTELNPGRMKRMAVRGAWATAVAQALKFALQFGSQIVLARMLDPGQFGLVALVAPVIGLVISLNDFGLGQAIVQRESITQRQLSALFWLNLAIGAAFTAVAMLAAPVLAWAYDEPRAFWVTLAAAALIPLTSLGAVPLALLNRRMRFVALGSVEVVAMFVGLMSGILAAWLGAGYWSIVIMQAVNAFVATTLAWLQCGWRPNRPAAEPGVGSLMRFGANVMVSNVAGYLSTSADNVIVGLVNGQVALGLYDRSYNLVVKPLGQLMAPVGRVAIPLLARLQTPDRYARAYLSMLEFLTVICVPGLIATIVCAEPLIGLLLGPKWVAMSPIFAWICIGALASPLSSSTYWLFITQNRTEQQMRCNVVCALISVASFALGSLWGVEGVARVAALSFILIQMPLVIWAATGTGAVTRRMVVRSQWPLAVASIVAAGAASGALHYLPFPRFALLLATYASTYATFLAALWVQPAGRRIIHNARGLLSRGDRSSERFA